MAGKSVKVAAAAGAAVIAAGALTGCGASPKVGTAALVGDDRITVTTLSQTVRDWREQFRTDPRANELRANPGSPGQQLGGESESDLRGALTLMINFRVADEVAEKAGVTVTGAEVDGAVDSLNRQGGAASITLASGLPRAHVRDLARLVATQRAVMQRFGADLRSELSPATQQAGQKWNELFRSTADGMDIEVNPRYGSYDPGQFEVGPVRFRLSSPDSGTRGA
ncbi:hypothetical protein E1264_07755 [Actinomadura sp. KC216]|uniref:hypothetical protein n=1 Tax=Actinomadura sp. KC216 TaxID=2530370 RepID=UPI00104B079B|nr:hypothetical protein [Actinomadura sp. KC216]TDB89588.1 hypothetical protein E1264_07755 [Actinomadura sp. KC216]